MNAPGKEYLIHFDPEKCTQCHGCEIACKAWRDLAYGIRYRRVINLWDGDYPAVKSTAVSLACLHCAEPACAAVCPEDAISKSETDGRVVVDETLCTGCEACSDACPFDVPQFGDVGIMNKCDLCRHQPLAGADPPCVDTCPADALNLIEVTAAEKAAHEEILFRLMT